MVGVQRDDGHRAVPDQLREVLLLLLGGHEEVGVLDGDGGLRGEEIGQPEVGLAEVRGLPSTCQKLIAPTSRLPMSSGMTSAAWASTSAYRVDRPAQSR